MSALQTEGLRSEFPHAERLLVTFLHQTELREASSSGLDLRDSAGGGAEVTAATKTQHAAVQPPRLGPSPPLCFPSPCGAAVQRGEAAVISMLILHVIRSPWMLAGRLLYIRPSRASVGVGLQPRLIVFNAAYANC